VTLLFFVAAPFIVVFGARWAWRLQVDALGLVDPGLVTSAGVAAAPSQAEVLSVLVDDETVLMGIRSIGPGLVPRQESSLRVTECVLLLSIPERRCDAVARLQRWQASGAPALVRRQSADDTIEFRQVCTGQHVRLGLVTEAIEGPWPTPRAVRSQTGAGVDEPESLI
jgi:hypothetical protein